MTTSQLLRTLVGTSTLLVSSNSNNIISFMSNGLWSQISIPNARGMSVNSEFIAVASSDCVRLYNKTTGIFAGIINSYSNDIHEIKFIDSNKMIVCDSRASSLNSLSLNGNTNIWTVPGVDLGTVDSRSWVNGVCVENNLPKYVTALGISNIDSGWRAEAAASRGALIDIQSNEVVLHNLTFPHSPLLDGNNVWFLNSGLNQVCKWSPGDSDFTVVSTLHGWTRGIFMIGNYLLVGVSQSRNSALSNVISDPLAEPGISIIDKLTGQQLEFESLDVQEIFDIVLTDGPLV